MNGEALYHICFKQVGHTLNIRDFFTTRDTKRFHIGHKDIMIKNSVLTPCPPWLILANPAASTAGKFAAKALFYQLFQPFFQTV